MKSAHRRWLVAFSVVGALTMAVGAAQAENLWLYDVANAVSFHQAKSPGIDWAPYVALLDRAKEGVDRGDDQIVAVAIQQFLTLLQTRAHGMDTLTARDLYTLVAALKPSEPALLITGDPGLWAEQVMRVPESGPLATSPRCHEAGCDNWIGLER